MATIWPPRKIMAMHKLFGACRDSRTCGECSNLSLQCWRSRSYYKCAAYSYSCSEASDWRKYYPACGLYNKELPDSFMPVLDRLKHEPRKEPDKPIEGQIGMEV